MNCPECSRELRAPLPFACTKGSVSGCYHYVDGMRMLKCPECHAVFGASVPRYYCIHKMDEYAIQYVFWDSTNINMMGRTGLITYIIGTGHPIVLNGFVPIESIKKLMVLL